MLRWGTVLVGIVLTATAVSKPTWTVVLATLSVVYAAVRTLYPIRWPSTKRGLPDVLVEFLGALAIVAATGYWTSPLVFLLVPGVVAAGFATGFGIAVPMAAVASAVLTGLTSWRGHSSSFRGDSAGSMWLIFAAVGAGYGRRLFGEAERRTSTVLSRMRRLSETNTLLQQLNALAQTLPASLDFRETIAGTITQIRELLRPDAIAVFLWDASLGQWTVPGAEGVRVAAAMDERTLPVPVRRAGHASPADHVAQLVDLAMDGPGLTPAARCGIYAPLVARRTLVGVIAVEAQAADAFRERDVDLMTGIAEQAALAIDNALWFGRLRTVGAEEERTRIARDLHDRVAQALAYVAFELDRIVDMSRTLTVTTELDGLRHDVRRVVTEVRDTLYDLRTDVSDSHDLATTMDVFLDRVRSRSGLEITFDRRVSDRLSVPLERELWRIGQEAITNAERHARATTLRVEWLVSDGHARLAVIDNGCGFPIGTAGRMDSYGLLGMRERADAIGATLEIDAAPGHGTAIRCRLEVT